MCPRRVGGAGGEVSDRLYGLYSSFPLSREWRALFPSVIHWPQIRLADRRRTQHCDRRKLALPVSGSEALAYNLHFVGGESVRDDLRRCVSRKQPVEDRISLGVRDSKITFICLALNQVR